MEIKSLLPIIGIKQTPKITIASAIVLEASYEGHSWDSGIDSKKYYQYSPAKGFKLLVNNSYWSSNGELIGDDTPIKFDIPMGDFVVCINTYHESNDPWRDSTTQTFINVWHNE